MATTQIDYTPPASVRRAKLLEKILGKDWKVALPFVIPMLIIMVGLIAYPFLNAVSMSTTSLNYITGETVNVGFRNYEKLLDNSDYLLSMQNTFQFTVWSLTIKFITGMTIALLLNSRLPFRNIITGVMLLPWIVPEIVTALAWKSIYDPIFGGLNPILESLGLINEPLGWLSDPNLAMPSVIAVNVWKGIPFYTMLLLAGLKAVDRELLEAAEVDGANVVRRFRHVTLPGMRYVIVVTLLLSFISTFNSFGLIFLMTGGGPGGATRVYSILAWEKAIRSLQFGPGVAIAFSVAPLMIVLIWLLSRFMQADEGRASDSYKVTMGDRVMNGFNKLLSYFLEIVFFPFEMVLKGTDKLFEFIRSQRSTKQDQPLFKRKERERMGLISRIVLLIPIILFVIFPLYWVVVTSFKTTPQISARENIFVPDPFTTEQYTELINDTPFTTWFKNTVIVATISTVISVVLAALAAYALSRLKFRGSGVLTNFLLITYLLPLTMLFIPLYQTLTDLGLINTYGH